MTAHLFFAFVLCLLYPPFCCLITELLDEKIPAHLCAVVLLLSGKDSLACSFFFVKKITFEIFRRLVLNTSTETFPVSKEANGRGALLF